MTIRAIAFDAYGTLYDVRSVRAPATEMCGTKMMSGDRANWPSGIAKLVADAEMYESSPEATARCHADWWTQTRLHPGGQTRYRDNAR